jgi:L-iditol 2-dehydrogenase
MKALVKVRPGPGGVQLLDVDKPVPAVDEVCIRVHYVGVCGTDIHIIHDEYEANYPVIMGHEFSGVIESVGSAVTGFHPNDRVVSLTAGYVCGSCRYCREGLLLQCPARKSIGSGMNGAMAEYLVIKADRIFRIPMGVRLQEAALCEPLACCVRSVIEKNRIHAGDYVFVSGPGAIGQLVAQLAKICGAHVTVAGVQGDSERLQIAKQLGADEIITQEREDNLDLVERITGGRLYDMAFECAGVKASSDNCFRFLRRCGQYVQVGLFGRPVNIDMDYALIREIQISNSFAANPGSWEIALRLLERRMLRLEPLTSAIYSLRTSWQEAIKMTESRQGFKVLLDCINDRAAGEKD